MKHHCGPTEKVKLKRQEWGQGEEMIQALYAHMNNKNK
jgi:hypothetical protein